MHSSYRCGARSLKLAALTSSLAFVTSSTEQTQAVLEAFGGEPGVMSLYGFDNINIAVWHAKRTVAAAHSSICCRVTS